MSLKHAVMRNLGWGHGELLAWDRYVLFVEGLHDELVLSKLFGDQLSQAGVRVLPLSGIDEAKSLTELRLIQVVLDVQCGLLADHTRIENVRTDRVNATKEERALRDLRRELQARGRKLDFFGLAEPDILCCLPEAQVREELPDFPGWKRVKEEWSRQRGVPVKDVVQRLAGERLHMRRLGAILDRMTAQGVSPRGDLPAVANEILYAAQG